MMKLINLIIFINFIKNSVCGKIFVIADSYNILIRP